MKIANCITRRCGSAAPLIVFGIVAVSLIGVALYLVAAPGQNDMQIDPIIATVERSEFVSLVLDQGEVQSSENVEIRCEVRSQNRSLSVIEVVPEGTRVRGGDFLVRLDSSSFEQELESQKIVVANAETEVIQADAALKTAAATLKEYEQGIFVEKKKEIENDIYDAESQKNQAQAVLVHSKKLQGKGFITKQQLTVDAINVKRLENLLELQTKKLDVLERITFFKETVQLKSDIEASKVKLANEIESRKVELNQKKEIEDQIEKCVIRVPEDVEGQVVYAKESSRGGNDWVLEEGTTVRENQVLVRLPNPDKMEVKTLINEQSITQIHEGMHAEIRVNALTNQTLKGIVTKVNQYAESSGWMSSSIRKYAVFVRILNPPEALKPGMNAAVSIQTRYESDALTAPIQSIYAVQDKQFCLVWKGIGVKPETRPVEINGDNSQVVLISGGLEEGEQLVMNPGAYKELMDLPELELDTKIEIPEDAKNKLDSELAANKQNKAGQTSEESAGPGAGPGGRRGEGRDGGQGGRGDRQPGDGRRGGGPGGQHGGGMGGFTMPKDGASFIKDKDTDGDGKLTKEEAGSPYNYFFDRINTDSDGFLNESEADASIKRMTERMQGGGGGGGGRGFGGGG